MKRLLSPILLFAINLATHAQNSKIEIDPRQYVQVMYRKYANDKLIDTIWSWEKRKDVPNQKRTRLNQNGELTIAFEKDSLAHNKEFEGNISLEAEITGSGGTRKIEVSPYSEVGVERQKVGYDSDPPGQIATRFLNMILELDDVRTLGTIDSIDTYLFDSVLFYNTYINMNQFIDLDTFFRNLSPEKVLSTITPTDANFLAPALVSLQQELFEKAKRYENYAGYLMDINSELLKFIDVQQRADGGTTNYKYSRLKGYFESIKSVILNFNKRKKQDVQKYKQQNLITDILRLRDIGEVVSSYMNSFTEPGEDAQKAFFSFINKDNVSYQQLKSNIDSSMAILKKLQLKESDPDGIVTTINPIKRSIKNLYDELLSLSQINGTKLEHLIVQQYRSKIDSPDKNKMLISTIREIYDSLIVRLSDEAGKIIYKKLVFATIDLNKSGAKSGEVLNVYITWKIKSLRASEIPPRLTIGKYYITESGWHVDVSDMFAMVQRLGESKDLSGNVSPSNFKGTGGATLMLTYLGEDKGLRIIPEKDNEFTIKKKNRILNAIQPSIGINVSYLDFSTTKDVEVGTGLLVGIFRNKIFFGSGLNLHMIGKANISPYYMFVGFSFAKLEDLFKNKNGNNQ